MVPSSASLTSIACTASGRIRGISSNRSRSWKSRKGERRMSNAKALPIATAVAGLLAAIGITIKLATTSTKPPIPLEDRVDELLAHEKELVESDPFENLTFRIQEFSEVADESRNLPRAKQLQVAKCLRALRALEN